MNQVVLEAVSRDMLRTWGNRSVISAEPDGQQLHLGYVMLLVLLRQDL